MPYEDYWNNIKNYLPLLMNINKKSLPHIKIAEFVNRTINYKNAL